MRKVLVSAKIEKLDDVVAWEAGKLPQDQIKTIEVADALVDTGAMMLSMPASLIDRLGLKRRRKRTVRTASGVVETNICDPVQLTVQDRDCVVEVLEIAECCPVLVGQLPLEALDFVVDLTNRRLIGNPEHGGQQMVDAF